MPRWFAAPIIAGCLAVGACATTPAVPEAAYGPCGDTREELVAAAKAEGSLNLLGAPDDWAGYGAIIAAFEDEYGIAVDSLLPQLDSYGQLTILRTWRGDPRFPDVIDVSPQAMDDAVGEGLIERFQPPAASAIAPQFRDPNGYWIAPYAGFIGFAVDPDKVAEIPTSWADLRKPEYRDAIAMRADPRTSGVGKAVVIAALLASGGTLDDAGPGIAYFGDLWSSGNLRNGTTTVNDLRYAKAPIVIDWTFNIPAINAGLVNPQDAYQAVFPADGVFGSVYTSALPVGAPHPCAGRLWLDEMLSRHVGLIRAEALAVPPDVAGLAADPNVPEGVRRLLPPVDRLANLVTPTGEQAQDLDEQIDEQWSSRLPGWSPS